MTTCLQTPDEIEEARVMANYDDYEEVITKYLPMALKVNRSLVKELQEDGYNFERAYKIGSNIKKAIWG